MAEKGQTILTDHFSIRKDSNIQRSVKKKARAVNAVNNDLPTQSDNAHERKLVPELIAKDGKKLNTRKRKVEMPNRTKKTTKDLKPNIRNKLANLPPIDLLIEDSVVPAKFNVDVDNTPAFERFYNQSFKSALVLPSKYKLIVAMFVLMDRVISMLFNRKEVCAFFKIQKSVQEIIKRNFERCHLEQISTVYPEAYNFSHENYKFFVSDKPDASYHLIITPIFESSQLDGNKFNSSMLLERKTEFHSRILEIVKDYHETFLQSLPDPIKIDREKVLRWHSKFRLNSVPDIPLAKLPSIPNELKPASAREVFQMIKSKKVEATIECVTNKVADTIPVLSEVKPINPALKGIPQALLDKIRAKEKAKQRDEILMPPKVSKRKAMIAKIPELARIIRSCFLSEKKAAILLETIISKIRYSCSTSLSCADTEDHIKLIGDLAPKWLMLVTVSTGVYVKIKKDLDLNIVLKNIKEK